MRLGYLLQHLKTPYKDFYTTIASVVLNRKVIKLSPVLEKLSTRLIPLSALNFSTPPFPSLRMLVFFEQVIST